MTKFTPGPWKFDDQMFEIVADDEAIAEIVSVKDRTYTQNPPANHEATLANANLIAAAPDMYADALDTEHAYSWLMQELRDLQHFGATWAPEKVGLFADSLIAYCDAHQIGTRAVLAKAGRQ